MQKPIRVRSEASKAVECRVAWLTSTSLASALLLDRGGTQIGGPASPGATDANAVTNVAAAANSPLRLTLLLMVSPLAR